MNHSHQPIEESKGEAAVKRVGLYVNAIHKSFLAFKQAVNPVYFVSACQVYSYFLKCRFDLRQNQVCLQSDPFKEIQLAIVSNSLKAVFVTAGEPDPDDRREHLRVQVPAWPPFYLPVKDFAELVSSVQPKQDSDGQGQRQGQSAIEQAWSDFDKIKLQISPYQKTILISTPDCYKKLINQLMDCLLGYQLRELDVSATTMPLVEEVYVRPNVAFNFMHVLGITAFQLAQYHSNEHFFRAYEAS